MIAASKASSAVVFLCGGCVDLLVELQVKDEGGAEGLHQEAALGQMDGLREEKLWKGGEEMANLLIYCDTDLNSNKNAEQNLMQISI